MIQGLWQFYWREIKITVLHFFNDFSALSKFFVYQSLFTLKNLALGTISIKTFSTSICNFDFRPCVETFYNFQNYFTSFEECWKIRFQRSKADVKWLLSGVKWFHQLCFPCSFPKLPEQFFVIMIQFLGQYLWSTGFAILS